MMYLLQEEKKWPQIKSPPKNNSNIITMFQKWIYYICKKIKWKLKLENPYLLIYSVIQHLEKKGKYSVYRTIFLKHVCGT